MANNRLAPVTDFDVRKFKKLDDKHHQGLFCHAVPPGVRLAIIATQNDWDAVRAAQDGELGDSVKGQNPNLDFWCSRIISAFRQTVVMPGTCADDIAKYNDEGLVVETIVHAAARSMEASVAGNFASWEPLADPIYHAGEWPDLALTILWAIPMSSWESGRDSATLGVRMAHATAVFIKNQWNDPSLVWPAVRLPVLLTPNPWIPGFGIGRPGRDKEAVMAQACYAMDTGQNTLVIDREVRWRANSNQIQQVTNAQAYDWAKARLTEEL